MKNLLKTAVLATAIALPLSATAAPPAPVNFDVTVNLAAVCTVSAIAPIVFNLTAGVNGATSQNTTATVNCTTGLAYSMAVPAGGTAANVPYTLSLPGGVNATGTGGNQNHTITASIAAGTYNDCTGATAVAGVGCTQTNTHTFTVTF